MIIWLDNNLPPKIAPWISTLVDLPCVPIRDLGLQTADDREIFVAGRLARAVLLTKDRDFVSLVELRGAPPAVVWLTMGDTSTSALQRILTETLPGALEQIVPGAPLVEITSSM